MPINTNKWNKIRYTALTPVYDIAAGVLNHSRKRSIDALKIQPDCKILIVGAGTGLDLDHLPQEAEIYATDITPSMVAKIKKRNLKLKRNVSSTVMDGQNLSFSNNTFDTVILHLVLAVIPDPILCLKEAERVLKAGGKIAVFDKFVAPNKKISLKRKMANTITNTFFSDITRSFEPILASTKLQLVSDFPANLNGNFRIIQLTK